MTNVDHITKNEAERALWREWLAHPSDETRNRILMHYDMFVRDVANYYLSAGHMSGMEFDDLYSEGWLGLMEAFRRFKTDRGAFTSYAIHWVRASIRHAMRDKGRVITGKKRAIDHGEYPEPVLSLDTTVCVDPGESFDVDDALTSMAVREGVSRLPERERYVVTRLHIDGLTTREMGDEIGVSCTRVSQIDIRGRRMLNRLLVLAL